MLKRCRTLILKTWERDSAVDSRLETLPRVGSGRSFWPGNGAFRSRVRYWWIPRRNSYFPLTNRLFFKVLSTEMDEMTSYGAASFGSVTRIDFGLSIVASPVPNG